ncbi:MAG: hypothetical protein KAJ19_09335, partial [Gammaproteobacteria bacterium]|nr:hypothetical protein [Gammaproteobacteria bacterium]
MGVRKGVLDKQIISADPEDGKSSVRVVTTVALPAYTRIGNVITEDTPATGLPAIDAVSLAVGESVLLKDGASSIDNGIYVVTDLGDGSNPFILTRRGDADTVAQVNSGMNCVIEEGTQHGGTGAVFVLITPNPFVINVDGIDFVSNAIHTINSHDTGATGAELDTLTDGSNADGLHVHTGMFDVDGEIRTIDATPANIAQVTPTNDQAYTIWGVVTAHHETTSNTRHWLFMLSGKRVAGV